MTGKEQYAIALSTAQNLITKFSIKLSMLTLLMKKRTLQTCLKLKGGLFIYSVTDFDSRVTVDVDFLLRKVPNTPEQLQTVIETIISTPTGNDFVFFEMKDIAPIAVAKKLPTLLKQR